MIPIEKDLFAAELNRLFGDGTVMDCPVVVGHVCYGSLGNDLRVRAEFVSSHVQQEYDALRLTILNRTDGKVDQLQLFFSTIWGRKPVNKLCTLVYFLVINIIDSNLVYDIFVL